METIEELVAFLTRALDSSARGRVVDRGESWSIIRRDGALPPRAPDFSPTLDGDLAEYGFALLDAGLALNHLDRGHALARRAFVISGRTFESLVRNCDPADPRRGFHRVIAAASYHLGSYSAIAYALFRPVDSSEENLNVAEICLIKLMLRDLEGVRTTARNWLREEANQDPIMAARLRGEDDSGTGTESHQFGAEADAVPDLDDSYEREIARVLISCVCRALGNYEFALRTGSAEFTEESREILSDGLTLAAETGLASLWWVIRVALALLDDLWVQSLHVVLPRRMSGGASEAYTRLRTLFISSLFARDLAEVELWPSQIDAARRAADPADNLVVALPTSAGKTRIAELAALTTLAMRARVLIVTPLRALSAQSERSFRARFAPLGATVSSLYGASGLSAGDEGALRDHDIVIATPEKLDFALRSDPAIIANVGLIVLDEGHLIGPEEREIRYEVLVQRLLRRSDAGARRIVCLSAILPDDEQLDDMTAWIRSDEEGRPVLSDWRPTRQRYGTLEWRGRGRALELQFGNRWPICATFCPEVASARQREEALSARTQRRCPNGCLALRRAGKAYPDLHHPGQLG